MEMLDWEYKIILVSTLQLEKNFTCVSGLNMYTHLIFAMNNLSQWLLNIAEHGITMDYI